MRNSNVNRMSQTSVNILGRLGVSNIVIGYDEQDRKYKLIKTGWISRLLGLGTRINYTIKLIYLTLVLFGAFPEIQFEFLDYLTIGFWYLVATLLLVGETFWFRTYPIYEIIMAGWNIHNKVYATTRQPHKYRTELEASAKKKIAMHLSFMLLGTMAVAVQYVANPKYPVFTGYLVTEDSWRMTLIFGINDVGLLTTTWFLYGAVIGFSSIMGCQITLTLQTLAREIHSLPDNDLEIKVKFLMTPNEQKARVKSPLSPRQRSISQSQVDPVKTGYSFESLTQTYRQLMIYMEQLNEFASNKYLAIHIVAYIQMIGDVFIMIKLLRSGEADFMAVFFYMEDCGVCMYMLFKCFKSMGTVGCASEEFRHGFATLLARRHWDRRLNIKVLRTLKPVSLKIGPSFVGRETVGNAIMVLMNYYIMAALWK